MQPVQVPMNLRPVEYKIIHGDRQQVEKGVCELLQQDWVLHGDLKVTLNDAGFSVYAQAVVRVELLPPPGFKTSDLAVPMPGPFIAR